MTKYSGVDLPIVSVWGTFIFKCNNRIGLFFLAIIQTIRSDISLMGIATSISSIFQSYPRICMLSPVPMILLSPEQIVL